MSSESVWAKNQVELAEHLGCDRKTVQRWLKMEGNPSRSSDNRYDVLAWREWCNRENRLPRKAAEADKKLSAKMEAELETVRLRNRKLEMETLAQEGELMRIDEVCRVIGEMWGDVVSRLNALHHNVSPQIAGRPTAAECNGVLVPALQEVLQGFSLGEWAKKKAGWSKVYATLRDLQRTAGLGNGPSSTV